jgi:AbrB family looped-hinge helix DNA binding protein
MALNRERDDGRDPSWSFPTLGMASRYQRQWYSLAMRIPIDAAGRLVIPKALRDAAGIVPGGVVEATLRDGRIELEAPPAEVRLEKRDRIVVAVHEPGTPTLTTEDVQATIDRLRDER